MLGYTKLTGFLEATEPYRSRCAVFLPKDETPVGGSIVEMIDMSPASQSWVSSSLSVIIRVAVIELLGYGNQLMFSIY